MKKKLFLLDAMALIYRAHFAFIRSPRINSKGINTSAVFGFTNSLLDIINNEKPTHIGIVYDTDAPTFRHEQYKEYKANRDRRPEDITIAQPYIKKIAEAMGIPNIELDGYEADDVIGTLAKKASCRDFDVFMMTPDKDYAQLVEDCIYQFKPGYKGNSYEVYGVKEIKEKWGINEVTQVIDILGLMGDSIDNIPGIPGVGEKTAQKLIAEFGSVESLIENKHQLKGKLKESVETFADQAIMSKQLATIDINVPIEFNEEALLITPADMDALRELFADLEFRTLGKRIFGETIETPSNKTSPSQPDLFSINNDISSEEVMTENFKTLSQIPHEYHLVKNADERQKLAEYLKKFKVVAFDTETSALNVHLCEIIGFSFSVKEGEAFYVSVPQVEGGCDDALKDFKEIFEDEHIKKIGQNIKYDLMVLKKYGINLKGDLFDTMIAHYLLEPDQRHNMDWLAQKYLNYAPISIETLIGKGKKQRSMADLSPEDVYEYACEDADVALRLFHIFEPELKATNQEKLFYSVEMPLISVLAEMETKGINLDPEALRAYSKELRDDLRDLEASIYELAGMTFNLNSPMQLGEVLFEKLKLDDKAKRTQKSKQYATGEDVLLKLAAKHDICQKILDYRSLQKLKSTYVDTLPLLLNPNTKRIHTSYNQAVAATGRLSSTDPNLQNIPIRTERGREIRKAFIPESNNHTLLSADYSQIELRLIAELSNDEAMMDAFLKGYDIHTSTAARIYNIPEEEVTSEMRRVAKTVNFGIIYGISAFGLGQRLNISRTEAAIIIEQYNKQYPGIQQYLAGRIEFARENGYVETLLGRRRYLRDINSGNATQRGYAERNAINAPIQGSAADMIKIAMINIQKEIEKRKLKSRMILQVHDELVFDVINEELEEINDFVKDLMKNALKLKVPIEVEIGTGNNWLEAH